MADEVIIPQVTLEYKDLLKVLEKYNAEMPGIAVKLMRAVNTEAKKEIKRAYKQKGYTPHKQASFGDAGFMKNLVSYANRDFSAKIIMKKNGYHYKFLEFGTNHQEMRVKRNGTWYKVKGFSVPARPVLYPVANSIWKTNRAEQIMERAFQKEIDKINKEK